MGVKADNRKSESGRADLDMSLPELLHRVLEATHLSNISGLAVSL